MSHMIMFHEKFGTFAFFMHFVCLFLDQPFVCNFSRGQKLMLRMLWKKVAEIGINDKIPLTIYHSKRYVNRNFRFYFSGERVLSRSNLRVAIASTPGPMVNGRITFGDYLWSLIKGLPPETSSRKNFQKGLQIQKFLQKF